MYNDFIQKHIDALEMKESDDIRKYNILDTLNNVGSIFTGTIKMCRKKQRLKEVLKGNKIKEDLMKFKMNKNRREHK